MPVKTIPANKAERYKYPPVTEAVIGVNFAQNFSNDLLKSVSTKLAKNYPIHQPLQNLSFNLNLNAQTDGSHQSFTQVEAGHRHSSPDMTELALALPNSFVVSQLAPYPTWDVFLKRFKRDWKHLKRSLGHQEIKRVGLRYINRIDIPTISPIVHHEHFLNVFPQVPDILSPLMAGAIQTVSYVDEIKCKVTLNSGLVESPILNHTSFLLDLDVAREIELPRNDEELFALLDSMRLKKNQIFEACISQRARDEIFNRA